MSKQTLFNACKYVRHQLAEAHVAFAIVALLFGIFFVIKIPLGATNDEQAHDFRAYMVSKGELASRPVGRIGGVEVYGGSISNNLFTLETQTAWAKGIRCVGSICHRPPGFIRQTNDMARQRLNPYQTYKTTSRGAAQYIFLPYIPAAIGFKLAGVINTSTGHAIELARFTSLLFFVLVTSFALFVIRKIAVRWLLFAVAMLPQTIIMGSSVTVDTSVIVLSFVLFALIVRACCEKKLYLPLKILLYGSAILLPLIKSPYIFISFITLFLPVYPKGHRGLAFRAVLLIVILALPLWFTGSISNATQAQATLSHAGSTPPDFHGQLHFIISRPVTYGKIFIKTFFQDDWLWMVGGPLTHQQVRIPSTMIAASYTLVLAGALASTQTVKQLFKRRIMPRIDLLMVSASLLAIVGVITSLYVIFNSVGYSQIAGVNGRYFIPILPFLFLGLALASGIKVSVPRFGRGAFIIGNIAVLLMTTVWWYYQVYVWALPTMPVWSHHLIR